MDSKRLLQEMMLSDIVDVRNGYIACVRSDKKRVTTLKEQLLNSGFVIVDPDEKIIETSDKNFLSDGRIVVDIVGVKWAVPKEFHEEAVANAAKRARQQSEDVKESVSVPLRVCSEIIDELVCGGELTFKPQCSQSFLGQQGVIAVATCSVCGHESVIMRGAK